MNEKFHIEQLIRCKDCSMCHEDEIPGLYYCEASADDFTEPLQYCDKGTPRRKHQISADDEVIVRVGDLMSFCFGMEELMDIVENHALKSEITSIIRLWQERHRKGDEKAE